MTALIIDNRDERPTRTWNVRASLTRLGRSIDAMVSGLAARSVPEWRMREVEDEIAHYRASMRRETIGPGG
jgi:hypothetical protein